MSIFSSSLSADAKLIMLALESLGQAALKISASELMRMTSLSRRRFERAADEISAAWPGSIVKSGQRGAPLECDLSLITVIKLSPREFAHSDQTIPSEFAHSDQTPKFAHSDQTKPKFAHSDQTPKAKKFAHSDQTLPKKFAHSDQTLSPTRERARRALPPLPQESGSGRARAQDRRRQELALEDDTAALERAVSIQEKLKQLSEGQGLTLDAWILEIFGLFGRSIDLFGASALAMRTLEQLGDAATARIYIQEKLTEHSTGVGKSRTTDQGLTSYLQQDAAKWLRNRRKALEVCQGIDQDQNGQQKPTQDVLRKQEEELNALFR